MRGNHRSGYFALAVYSSLAVLGFWFPLAVALVTTFLWVFWLVYGITRFEVL